jgi:histidyl-tRNA synthetase
VGGGGRYDGLVEMLGGPPTPGIGFGIGIERVLLARGAEGLTPEPPPPLDAFVVDVTDGTAGRDLTHALWRAGLRAERSYDGRSMKAQMKLADRSGARCALIVGAKEREAGTVTLRPLRSAPGLATSTPGGGSLGADGPAASQESVHRDEVIDAVRRLVSPGNVPVDVPGKGAE